MGKAHPLIEDLCVGGLGQGFTVLEKCSGYTCDPRGDTGHIVTLGQKAALREKHPQSRLRGQPFMLGLGAV